MPEVISGGAIDVVVVGGGPAGLSAATAAADAGSTVMVIERDERLGGVLNQCIHDGFGILEFDERLTGPEYANRQVSELGGVDSIRVMTGAYLHSVSRESGKWHLNLVTPAGISRLRARALIMATGCRERTDRQIYLHGDRPAGVFTAGQAQRLINIDGIMPGRNVVILGSGDIGLIMARRLVLEGANVIGVHEIMPRPSGLARNVAQCLEDWDIPLHLSSTVTEVHGRSRIQSVTVCPVDASGRPDTTRAELVPCDTLLLSVGLIPENDLLVDMGMTLDPDTGGVEVTQERKTALPGLFVCGNALHVYDLVDYVSECGRAAGEAAARLAAVAARTGTSTPGVTANADPHATAMRLTTAGAVSHVVPQLLDTSCPVPPVLFYRATGSLDRARLTLRTGERHHSSHRVSYVRPSEMGRFQLPDVAWSEIRRTAGAGRAAPAITIALEET